MNIAVFGLGNVGLVTALCLCERGHRVVGIEVNAEKVKALQDGVCYLLEDGLPELLFKHKSNFVAQTSGRELRNLDCIVLCVGTPSGLNGEVNLDQIRSTLVELVNVLKNNEELTVILRSTVPPGTVEKEIIPILKSARKEFQFIYHPEFLREGSAVRDFLKPHLHVVGLLSENDKISCPELFADAEKILKVPVKSAEMLKYMNNIFHAIKVAFANEISSLAFALGVPIDPLFNSFFADTKLNLSKSYLNPGYSFGGPCLTKEIISIEHLAIKNGVSLPLINSLMQSNNAHMFRLLFSIEKDRPSIIIFFGVSFKSGTDDIRSSPVLDLANLLQKRPSYLGPREIWIHDSDLAIKKIENRRFVFFDDLPSADPDVIILGSHKLNLKQLSWVLRQNCKIYDLQLNEDIDSSLSAKTIKAYEVL